MRRSALFALALAISSSSSSFVAAPAVAQPRAAAPRRADALGPARDAFEHGKFAEADKLARAAARSASYKDAATALRAEILAAQGKLTEAIHLLEGVKSGKGEGARTARLLLGEYLIRAGRRADADAPLHAVIEEYNDGTIASSDAAGLADVGRAAYLLRSPKDANTAFNESERVDKKRVKTLLWRAELFLDKYDPGHAEEVLREALEIEPDRADALVMMARVKLAQTLDFDEAEALVQKALAIDPKHTGAYAVRAGLALRDMDIVGADEALARGLAVNPHDLELLSMNAAVRFLADDAAGFAEAKKRTLAQNPQFSDMYRIIGEYAEWEHRYDDMVGMMKEATKIDPDDAKAWAVLGLTQMRAGDETHGLESLKKAWSKDHFNVRVFNTLNLYEQQIPTQYALGQGGVFKVRYPKDERAVMERYVPRMLGEAWASMKARYGFVPSVPVQVELYASREQFSVRTSGLPNMGIQGVCFGHVVAAISPHAEPFNWGNVVWHELGHVFAIQLSKNHVPRWFTEGLSEYETLARRPEWGRELDPELYVAITRGRLPGAVDMNRAFTHAADASEVTVAYYAASQMLVWTVETFGMPKVVEALRLWGQGKKTPEVIRGAFGVTPDEYDRRFRAWALARMSRYKHQYLFSRRAKALDEAEAAAKASPKDAAAQVDLALALLRARKAKEAHRALDAALAIDKTHPDARYVSAKLAMGEKDLTGAEQQLAAMIEEGHGGYTVRMLLAEVAQAADDKSKLRLHLEAARRLDPSQSAPLKGLFKLADAEDRDADALDALRALARLEQHDRAVWRELLSRLVSAKAWDEARRVGESAVFVDVLGGNTHALYARALAAQNAHDQAIYELESALLCPMKKKDAATAHALLARELLTKKRTADAKKHRDEALKLDPNNAAAKALKL